MTSAAFVLTEPHDIRYHQQFLQNVKPNQTGFDDALMNYFRDVAATDKKVPGVSGSNTLVRAFCRVALTYRLPRLRTLISRLQLENAELANQVSNGTIIGVSDYLMHATVTKEEASNGQQQHMVMRLLSICGLNNKAGMMAFMFAIKRLAVAGFVISNLEHSGPRPDRKKAPSYQFSIRAAGAAGP